MHAQYSADIMRGAEWDMGLKRDAGCSSMSAGMLCYCRAGCVCFFSKMQEMSTLFGVDMTYKTDIGSELDCIASAQSQEVGACVFEKDYDVTCTFQTRGECGAETSVNGSSSGKTFYPGELCSSEELGTDCARQTETGCFEQQVYWFDSCGNRENVYSSDRDLSWNDGKAASPDEICPANDGSNKDCGNCNYVLGTRCAEISGILGIGKPSFGDFVCKRTDCTDRYGDKRKNGESWCVYDGEIGNGADAPGSRHYKEVCIDGNVVSEPCGDLRSEICIEENVEGAFSAAACRVNRWQDCLGQTKQSGCENTDRRDCMFIPLNELPTVSAPLEGSSLADFASIQESFSGSMVREEKSSSPDTASTFTNPTDTGEDTLNNPTSLTGGVVAPITGAFSFGGEDPNADAVSKPAPTAIPEGICLPSFPPGFTFWQESDAEQICSTANVKCVVYFEKKLYSDEECVDNCECLEESWAGQVNGLCNSLGDCGAGANFAGKATYDGADWRVDGKPKKFSSLGGFGGGAEGAMSEILGRVISVGSVLVTGKAIGGLRVTGRAASLASAPAAAQQVNHLTEQAGANILDGPMPLSDGSTLFDNGILSADGKTFIPHSSGAGGAGPTSAVQSVSAVSAVKPAEMFVTKKAFSMTLADGTSKIVPAGTSVEHLGDAGGKFMLDGKEYTLDGEKMVGLGKDGTLGGTAAKQGSSALSRMFGATTGHFADALLTGLQWGAVAFGIGYLIGSLFGMSKNNTMALGLALGAGTFAWQGLSTWTQTQGMWLGQWALPIGIGVAAAVFIIMYKEESTKVVTFECLPWQAPLGSDDCEVCNEDDLKACSEYRCKSLGNCELVNPGTEEETCVKKAPSDVTPPVISPDENALTSGLKYSNTETSPPSPGVSILGDGQECIKAFTPFEFGIISDKPAQCKIDMNASVEFEEMSSWFGGSNLFRYNHTQKLILPGPADLEAEGITLNQDGRWKFFVKCRDANGNAQRGDYEINFCIDPAPDMTAPQVVSTSINSGMCVAEGTEKANIDFYVNKPSDCKWDREDKIFEQMNYDMRCSQRIYEINSLQLYTCSAELEGFMNEDTNFYIRCKGQPGKPENERSAMQQSYVFKLKGSPALVIKSVEPNATITGYIKPYPVNITVQTLFGCNNGKSVCSYSTTGDEDDYITFSDTDKDDGIHTQRLDLLEGAHKYYIKCVDEGGNSAVSSTTFDLKIDTSSPVVARVYEEDDFLKIVTTRASDCSYSLDNCEFSYQEGTPMLPDNSISHLTEWAEGQTYYIKCKDKFRAEPTDCSIVVKPASNFFS